MPVDQKSLLADCQKQLKLLEADLKAQATALPDLDAALRAEYADAREAGRVGDAFEIWRGEQATQAAVHWVLGGVFVRFLEDNGLIDPLLAGAGDRGRLAEAAEQAYYAAHPTHHERDWLLHAFRAVAALPGGAALFDEAHNPAFRWPLSPDAAKKLVQFWRRPDPATGGLVHDFANPAWDTRFLGDLYQDLSEGARKKYALLQTPVFVEEFILDRTLGEALKVLPLPKVTLIDPTVGSGHFLLGAFARLLAAWEEKEPTALREELAQRALDQVAGVDLNPFAVAIARFRLLMAALRACGVARLERAPAFRLHVAVGDTLLHGDEPGRLPLGDGGRGRYVRHAFTDEDLAEVTAILSRRYAVVVGNPPYITPKDSALRVAYKERYRTCYMQYALSVPFVERFWELAASDVGGGVAGWVGQITARSFMKREFGKKLIEEFFPRVDLTHVIDTANAHIPGHGTPTAIMLGRNRRPTTDVIRAVYSLKREAFTPADPSSGAVWTSIREHIDHLGFENEYISVSNSPRSALATHPWSMGGGGAADLRLYLEGRGTRLGLLDADIGSVIVTGEDGCLLLPAVVATRCGIELTMPIGDGEAVRNWTWSSGNVVLWPYDASAAVRTPREVGTLLKYLWCYRTPLRHRKAFSVPVEDRGLKWWELREVYPERVTAPFLLVFAFVATHNHFALRRRGAVFKHSVLTVRLRSGGSETDYLGLLGLANSSVACFWLKQVSHNMGGGGIGGGIAAESWEQFYQFNAANLVDFPAPPERPVDVARQLDLHALSHRDALPTALVGRATPTQTALAAAYSDASAHLGRMIALQEELDWCCYRLYGLTEEALTFRDGQGGLLEPPAVRLGERAFEIVLARRMAAGEEETTWFTRHGSTPVTEVPSHWPAEYRALVERRIARIEADRNIALIERPEYKRRWNVEPWETLERQALAGWLLDRLESPAYWPDIALQSTRDLAARAALDSEFAQVAALWVGAAGVELEPMIRELVLGEAVPFLSALRYTESGREKRRVWEQTWELQREEDAVDAAVAAGLAKRDGESDDAFTKRLAAAQKARRAAVVGAISRPPKYASADFQQAAYWRMRGALDVPKERFILYPYCGREGDDAPLLGWAGWNHLQQAQALSSWYADRMQQDGWQGERVLPMLVGMAELVPWLKQWHNQLDPVHGDRPGETYASWLDGELHAQGLTRAALEAWEPPKVTRRGGRRGGGGSARATVGAAE